MSYTVGFVSLSFTNLAFVFHRGIGLLHDALGVAVCQTNLYAFLYSQKEYN